MKYQAVIFDLFGTLIDNLPFEGFGHLLTDMATILAAPREEFAREWVATFDQQAVGFFTIWEENISHVCRACNFMPSPARVAMAARLLPEFVACSIQLRPDALETVSQLKSTGYKIGLVSDCSMEIPALWPTLPLAALIDQPVFSCAVGVRKPDPRIYRLACERLGVRPQECLYVGDGSSRELTGAAQLGMQPVLISVPYDRDYDQWRPDAVEWRGARIARLSDLLSVIAHMEILEENVK